MTKIKYIFSITCGILFITILTIGCIQNDERINGQDVDKSTVLLTIIFDDYQTTYTLEDLEAIESYSGTGRYIKTKLLPESVVISETHEYTGVRITTLLELVPNLPENYNISIISNDGWTKTFIIDEIFGGVEVYNEEGNVIQNETAVMIIAFKEDGSYYSEIDPEDLIGPLRIAFVGNDVIVSSALWSKMVISIDIQAI